MRIMKLKSVFDVYLFSNLGGRWVKTFFLWFVDIITWKTCIYDETMLLSNATASLSGTQMFDSTLLLTDNKCVDKAAKAACIESGGRCRIDIDGYYIEVAMNVVYGIIWYQWGKRVLYYLGHLQRHEWHVLSNRSTLEMQEVTPLDDPKDKV